MFRSAIAAQNAVDGLAVTSTNGQNGIFVYPSFTESAIEGGGQALMGNISRMVERLDLFTEERDALAASLFADSYHLTFDADGRVILPEAILAHAHITKELCFVGLGEKFQIWEPERFSAYRDVARQKAMESRALLRSNSHVGDISPSTSRSK
jgi:MraZ protein